MGRLNSALCTGFDFRKGWKNERELFCSGEALPLVEVDDTLEDAAEDTDECDDTAPVLAPCEKELLELWLLAEFADEPEPPE